MPRSTGFTGHASPNRLPVKIDGKLFPSQTHAAEHFGVSETAIRLAIKRGTFRGLLVRRN
jgi:hypothetical protein